MNVNSLLSSGLDQVLGLLKMTVADMSDADLQQRPAEGANTANWQLGHLVSAQGGLLAMVGGPAAMVPEGYAEIYGGKPGPSTDNYLGKAQLLELFEKNHAAQVAWVNGLSTEQLDRPTPERLRMFAPNVAALIQALGVHIAMHMGQIQVLRRRLGKPVLF